MAKKDARVKKVASDEVESSISAGDSSNSSSVETETKLHPVAESTFDWRIDAVLVVAFLIMAAYTRFINIGDPKSVIFDEVRRVRAWDMGERRASLIFLAIFDTHPFAISSTPSLFPTTTTTTPPPPLPPLRLLLLLPSGSF